MHHKVCVGGRVRQGIYLLPCCKMFLKFDGSFKTLTSWFFLKGTELGPNFWNFGKNKDINIFVGMNIFFLFIGHLTHFDGIFLCLNLITNLTNIRCLQYLVSRS